MFRTPGTALTLRRADADRVFVAARIIDELELRDGERILVRPIQPADGDQLAGLHARLSRDSIYWRYFGFKSALSPAEIRRFTGIAEEWRFALVGVREHRAAGRGRQVRRPARPHRRGDRLDRRRRAAAPGAGHPAAAAAGGRRGDEWHDIADGRGAGLEQADASPAPGPARPVNLRPGLRQHRGEVAAGRARAARGRPPASPPPMWPRQPPSAPDSRPDAPAGKPAPPR